MAHHKLLHWSALTLKKQEVIDLIEYTPPAEVLYLYAKYLCNLKFFFLGLVYLVVNIQLYIWYTSLNSGALRKRHRRGIFHAYDLYDGGQR
jgi:hypothetical protein